MTGRLKDYLREGSESSLPDPTAMVALIQNEGLAFYRASDSGKLFVFDRTVPEWVEYTQLSLFSELQDVDWSTPPEDGQLFIWDETAMKLVPSDFPNSFPEAPEDGTPYSRQNAGWVPSPQGEVEEAPEDGTPYVRQDAGWVPGGGSGGEPGTLDFDVYRNFPRTRPNNLSNFGAGNFGGRAILVDEDYVITHICGFCSTTTTTSLITPAVYSAHPTTGVVDTLLEQGPQVTGLVRGMFELPLANPIAVTKGTWVYIGLQVLTTQLGLLGVDAMDTFFFGSTGALPATAPGATYGSGASMGLWPRVETSPAAEFMGLDSSLILLQEITLTADQATVMFDGIDQDFDDLVLQCTARTTHTGDVEIFGKFNNDSSAIYNYAFTNRYGSAYPTTDTRGRLGCALRGSLAAGVFARNSFEFFDYSSPDRNTSFTGRGYYPNLPALDNCDGAWGSNVPVTRIDLTPGTGSFQAGSRFRLYGRRPVQPGNAGYMKPWYWNPPKAANFPGLSGSTAPNPTLTDDDDVGLIVDFMGAVTGDEQRSAYVTLPTPTAPWKMTLAMRPQIPANNYSGCGLIAWDSVGGRNYVWEAKNGADLAAQRFSSYGTFLNTAYAEPALAGTREVYWFQIEFTGTQYIFRWSMNGKQWNTVLTLGVAEYLANPANRVGLTCTYNRSGGINNVMIVEHFELIGGGL